MILDLGITDYEESYRVQMDMVARRRLREIDDSLILAEHNAVITIGRGGLNNAEENLLVGEDTLTEYGIKVLSVDRGGDVTLHAPGQLVVYPIIDLKGMRRDLHLYMRRLEEAIISCLAFFKIKAYRVPEKTGVWVSPSAKIASIGIAATDWVTYHGLSLNVDPDLTYFSMIRICGFRDVRATSMREVLRRDVRISDVKARMVRELSRVLGIDNISYELLPPLDQ